jgi:hypothetical protein
MNDWVGFVDQRNMEGLKCCVIAFRGKRSTDLASIPDTLIFKNGFWVQRVATDERNRVLINPTALRGGV